MSLATIMGDYRQGPIEPGTFATDLAIGGKGYFQVVQGDNVHYTRAGNFRFNSAGFLLDPNGYVLQGQMITDEGTSSTGDLRLDLNENNLVVTEANATSLTTMVMNVNTDVDNTSSAGDPFFALMQSWNGRADPPLTTGAYDYSNAITVYDDQGQSHLLTVYFDGVPSTNANGDRYVEFVVGTDPSQDGRAAFGGTSGAGLLMAGVLTFNSAGQLMDMSAYTRSETASAGSGVLSLESWIPAAMDENGVPLIEARFAAASGATAGVISMGLDMGLTSADGAWQAGYGSNASVVGASTSAMASMSGAQRAALATTAYTGDASTLYQTQDGYGQGVLQSLSTDRNGIISGKFSNGVAKELMQVTLYVFPSEYGLRREGMNHFSETLNSGQAVEGLPDQEQYGALIGTSLEQSNVGHGRAVRGYDHHRAGLPGQLQGHLHHGYDPADPDQYQALTIGRVTDEASKRIIRAAAFSNRRNSLAGQGSARCDDNDKGPAEAGPPRVAPLQERASLGGTRRPRSSSYLLNNYKILLLRFMPWRGFCVGKIHDTAR